MFKLDVVDFNSDFELVKIGEKNIYNTDEYVKLTDWVEKVGKNECEEIEIKSAFNINGKVSLVPKNKVGSYTWQANNVAGGTMFVTIASGNINLSGKGKGFITPENFNKVTALFSARKLITPTWINCKDEYLAPNEKHPEYEQFTYDSIIYSLFNNSSQQSSLRQIDYKGKKWDIKNEFFWLSKEEMLSLSEENNYDEMYKDARTSDERFVFNLLFGAEKVYDKLSDDAKEVLNSATKLLKKSIEMRKLLSENNPQYHLDSWDAGYAQLKLVWKEYFKEEFAEFRDKYKQFENRLRPLVYELGFLKK